MDKQTQSQAKKQPIKTQMNEQGLSQRGSAFENLQQVVGNRFVQRLVNEMGPDQTAIHPNGSAETSTIQRDGPQTAQRTESLGSALARSRLEQVRTDSTARTFRLGAYSERGNSVVNKAHSKMELFSNRYRSAYDTYSGIIRAGRAEALNQQQWIDIFAGIAIGVGAGLASEAIVGEAVLSGVQTVLVEVATETGEAVATGGARGLGLIPQVAGQELEPGGLHPELINSRMWQTISRMYQAMLGVQRVSWYLPLLLGNTEYALGQLRLLNAGAEADMTESQLVEMALSLSRANTVLVGLDNEVAQKMAALDQVNTKLDSAPDYPERTIEQDIWIAWISGLSNDQSDILDLDAIEDHLASIGVLGGNSRLGVDFGWWTSKDDELEAISAAHREANSIHDRIDSMTSTGSGAQ